MGQVAIVRAILLGCFFTASSSLGAQQIIDSEASTDADRALAGSASIDATISDFYHRFGVQPPRTLHATQIQVECRYHPRFSPVLSQCKATDELSPSDAESWKIVRALGVWEKSPDWQYDAQRPFGTEIVTLSLPEIVIPFIAPPDGYARSIREYVWQYNPLDLQDAFHFGDDQTEDLEGRVEIECKFQSDQSIVCISVKTKPDEFEQRFSNVPRQFAQYYKSNQWRILGKVNKDAFRAVLDFQSIPVHCRDQYVKLRKEGDSYIMGYFPTNAFRCDETPKDTDGKGAGYKLRMVTVLDPQK